MSRWSAQLDERPGHQGPGLLGLPGTTVGGMAAPPSATIQPVVAGWTLAIPEPERPRRRHCSELWIGIGVSSRGFSVLLLGARCGRRAGAGRRQERRRVGRAARPEERQRRRALKTWRKYEPQAGWLR